MNSETVQNLLEDAEEEIAEALQDPEEFDFRDGEIDEVTVTPDNSFMRAGVVNLANGNVEIRYATHSDEEKYAAVVNEEDFSIVESSSVIRVKDEVGTSKIYYLVTENSTFMYDGGSWQEKSNQRPREVAEEAEKMYLKALNQEEDELDWGEDDDYVPPPEDEEISGSGFPL